MDVDKMLDALIAAKNDKEEKPDTKVDNKGKDPGDPGDTTGKKIKRIIPAKSGNGQPSAKSATGRKLINPTVRGVIHKTKQKDD